MNERPAAHEEEPQQSYEAPSVEQVDNEDKPAVINASISQG